MKTHPLFRAVLLLFICCSLQTAKGQWVSIPDTNFGMWLNTNGYVNCMQGNSQVGWQMDTSCPAVVNASRIHVSGPITNLTGLQYFHNVDTLALSGISVSFLPPLPHSLRALTCQYIQQLTTLPSLPATLTYLFCFNTPLTGLPVLPAGLTYLYMGDNQLVTLPVLPDSLTFLNFAGNHINTMPVLPNTLQTLAFGANNISNVPYLPPSLLYLYCDRNQITSLPELPDTLVVCTIGTNPLTCLPKLKYVYNLNFSNTLITCLPNRGNVVNSIPPLSSIPICDIYNANACEVYWNIGGRIHHDGNGNCFADSLEVRNIPVQLWQNGLLQQQTYSVGNGTYAFDADGVGSYDISIDTSQIPLLVSCPANNLHSVILTPADSIQENQNFTIECDGGFDLRVRNITSERFIPGNTSRMRISVGESGNFYDLYCATVGGVVTTTITGPAPYVSPAIGALTPTVSGNTLTYNVADFGNVNFFNDFDFVLLTDTSATLGSQVCITVSVTPTVGDNNPANNTLTHCFTVVGSYDPNDKQVYPSGDIDTAQEWLTYTVRFQNTGTAEAQHIYITDTLDSNIDVSSFQLLAYSHQPMVQIKENAVRFNYPNINLPDSNTNEPESHGYVQYKVKLKDNLSIGTQINNTAFIYFDFNEPVITNTTTNTISVISGMPKAEIATLSFEMFPNPANDVVSVIVDEQLIGAVLTVSDMTGRNMAIMNIEHRMSNIDVKDFSTGIYFVTITKNSRSSVKRLAVQK